MTGPTGSSCNRLPLFALSVVLITACVGSVAGSQPSTPIPTRSDLPASGDDVVLIRIAPFPEGPLFEIEKAEPDTGEYFDLLPDQLPEPLEQPSDCVVGAVVSLQLGGGGWVDYGPCLRPEGIEAIRRAVYP